MHPSTKQCNYAYAHPSTPQCNVSSRLDSIENKVNTTSGVPRWYFSSNGTWTCPESGTYTFILVGGGQGWGENSIGSRYDGHCGEYILSTQHINARSYTITIGQAGLSDANTSSNEYGGSTSIYGTGLSLSARGGRNSLNTNTGSSGGYEVGTLVGPGTVGRGGVAYSKIDAYSGAVAIY